MRRTRVEVAAEHRLASDDGSDGPLRAATGHLIGGRYLSAEAGRTYEVLGRATMWALAPDRAILKRWECGTTCVSDAEVGIDQLIGPISGRRADGDGTHDVVEALHLHTDLAAAFEPVQSGDSLLGAEQLARPGRVA